ncbi:hypothetical protein [Nocardia sp. NPDC059228]|uniref:hypothetical protein n=1 Tax=Nocardia sp. NPDC059228 TaxID=3346777 RepID=UPI0036BEE477
MVMPQPWETPQGQACIEKWIAVSMAKLNAFDGSPEFNARKPWSINQYGVLEGGPHGPHSTHAPDDFPEHGNNKYWWMWDHMVPVGPFGTWASPDWEAAHIESIQSFVKTCAG